MKKITKQRAALENWRKHLTDILLFLRYYISLMKFDQTAMVALTTILGYGMAPGVFDPVTFTCLMLGTVLSSAGAFTVNQVLEESYSSQMNRNGTRVLDRSYLIPLHATRFAVCCASIGLTTLCLGTNILTIAFGLATLILCTVIYTPMKRYSVTYTRLASLIGALPTLMGWSACTRSLSSGSVLLGSIIYSWQILRCNALSWASRTDYSRVGNDMTSAIDHAMCRLMALRHSVGLLVLCSCAPLLDLTAWTFAFDSFSLNCYVIYQTWKFNKDSGNQSSRELVRFNLIYLLTLFFLMLVGKKYSKDEKDEIASLSVLIY